MPTLEELQAQQQAQQQAMNSMPGTQDAMLAQLRQSQASQGAMSAQQPMVAGEASLVAQAPDSTANMMRTNQQAQMTALPQMSAPVTGAVSQRPTPMAAPAPMPAPIARPAMPAVQNAASQAAVSGLAQAPGKPRGKSVGPGPTPMMGRGKSAAPGPRMGGSMGRGQRY